MNACLILGKLSLCKFQVKTFENKKFIKFLNLRNINPILQRNGEQALNKDRKMYKEELKNES